MAQQGDVSGAHRVLIRSDGKAIACGNNRFGQCNFPELEEGVRYTQAAVGDYHTVLSRSDGVADACGDNRECQCNIPPLDEGVQYTQASCSGSTTVLLRSDGTAIACGNNESGQCDLAIQNNIPGLTYNSKNNPRLGYNWGLPIVY